MSYGKRWPSCPKCKSRDVWHLHKLKDDKWALVCHGCGLQDALRTYGKSLRWSTDQQYSQPGSDT